MRPLAFSSSRLLAGSHFRPRNGHERLGSHLILSSSDLGERRHHPLPATSSRPFSIQPFVEVSVATTQHLFTELHVLTGTPWYMTIPLIALSINLVGRLPISLYTRSVAQRRATLSPLLRAWYSRHAKDLSATPGSQEELRKKTDKRFKTTTKRMYKEWGVQRWKDFSFLGILPLWLTGIEAMRRLSGGSKGLLGTLFSGSEGLETAPATSAAMVTTAETLETPAENALSMPEAVSASQSILTDFPSGADPSLLTEGCLWFPDLTVADPLHILPLMLSAVLLWRLLPSNRLGFEVLFGTRPPPSNTPTQTYGRPLHRALLVLAVLVGPATMNLPAAVHLYWISSAVITNVQSDVINRLMKLPKAEGHFCQGRESTLVRPLPPQKAQGS